MIRKRYSIEDAEQMAHERGGRFLTEGECIKSHNVYLWECSKKHQFKKTFSEVKFGSWCRKCRVSYGEFRCKNMFERIFNVEFHKIRPKWLKNITGFLLELDGYNPEMNIAFEFQGEQHYRQVNSFHKDINDFNLQINRDKLKVEKCKDMSVKLFIIKDCKNLTYEMIVNQIKEQCIVLNINTDNLCFDVKLLKKKVNIKPIKNIDSNDLIEDKKPVKDIKTKKLKIKKEKIVKEKIIKKKVIIEKPKPLKKIYIQKVKVKYITTKYITTSK